MTRKDMIMDAETKKTLIGMLPFNDKAVYEYRCDYLKEIKSESNSKKIDVDKFIPVLKLRSYTQEEKEIVSNIMAKDEKEMSDEDEKNFQELARKALVGWENMWDISDGKIIEFEADKEGSCKKELFDNLPVVMKTKVLQHAAKISGLLTMEYVSLLS